MKLSAREIIPLEFNNVQENPPKDFEAVIEENSCFDGFYIVLTDCRVDEDYVYLSKDGNTYTFMQKEGTNETELEENHSLADDFIWETEEEAQKFLDNYFKNVEV